MPFDALMTLGVVTIVIGLLAFSRVAPDVVLLGGLTLLMVFPVAADGEWRLGVLSPSEVLSGLSNPGPVTVGVLFIVVAGPRETGGIDWLAWRVLGRPRSLVGPHGYLTTCEQDGALVALDLSDPANPQRVGEVEVPAGPATILPVDGNHLVSVSVESGDAWPWQSIVRLTLLDIADLAAPVLIDEATIGDGNTFSEAAFNPRSVTWLAPQGLLALPVHEVNLDWFGTNGWRGVPDSSSRVGLEGPEESGEDAPESGTDATEAEEPPVLLPEEVFGGQWLVVCHVDTEQGFDQLRRISIFIEGEGFRYQAPFFTRGVFIEDHVYAVTNTLVAAASLADLTTVTALVELPVPEDPFPWLDTQVDDQPADSDQEAGDNSSG